MISNIAVIQGAVVAIANFGLFSIFAISIRNNPLYGQWAWAILLTWASLFAALMLTSVYLVSLAPKSVDNFRAATVLSSLAA